MKRMIMAAAMMLVACAAYAQDEEFKPTFKVGVGAVFSDYEGDPSFPVSDSSLGMQFYAQARANSWFGIEAGYYNSGTFKQDIDPNNDGLVELSLSGFNIAAVGFMPIFPEAEYGLELYGKVGLYDYDIDITAQVGNSTVPGSLGHSTGLYGGGGIVLYVTESIGIRTDLNIYDIDNADLWSMNLGIEIGFK